MSAIVHHQEQITGLRSFGPDKEIIVATTNSAPYRAFLIDANPAGDPAAPAPLLPDGVIGNNVGAIDTPMGYSAMYPAGSGHVQVRNGGNIGGHLLALNGGGGFPTVVMANKISAPVGGLQTVTYESGKVSAADIGRLLFVTASGNMKNDGRYKVIGHATVAGPLEELTFINDGEAFDPGTIQQVRTQLGRAGDQNAVKAVYINPETLQVDIEQEISHQYDPSGGPATNVFVMDDVPNMAWAAVGGEGTAVGFDPMKFDVGNGASVPFIKQRVVNGKAGDTLEDGGRPYVCSVMQTGDYLVLSNRESNFISFHQWDRDSAGRRTGFVKGESIKVYLDGATMPCRMFTDRFDRHLYIARLDGRNINVIDLRTLKLVQTINCYKFPFQITWSQDGTKGFLAHNGSEKIIILDGLNPGVKLGEFDTGVPAGKSNRHSTLTRDGIFYTVSHNSHLITATDVRPVLNGTGPAVNLSTWTLTAADFTGLASPSTNPRNCFIMKTGVAGARAPAL